MLDERYLELQRKVELELDKVDESELQAGKVIDPTNVFDTQLDLQHYKELLNNATNESFIIEYSKEVTMLDNIDEQYYNVETGKGLSFDELLDYYNIIKKALGYKVVDYNNRLKVIDNMLSTLVDYCDFDITDVDFYKGVKLISVDDELVEQVNLMKNEYNDANIMRKASRITELSDYKDNGVGFVTENRNGYDLLSESELTVVFDFLNEWISSEVDDDDVLVMVDRMKGDWF